LSGLIHWRNIFLIPGIFGLILCLHVSWWLPSFKPVEKKFRMNYIAAFRNKAILNIFSYIFLISLIYHGVQQWLAVYFSSQFHFAQFTISMLITLTSLSGIFGEIMGGWLSDALGRFKTINLGIILMIVSAFALILKAPLVLLAAIVVIWGLGWTINHAGVSTMLTDLPQSSLNEAASLNSGVRFISGGLGAALGGLFIEQSFILNFIIFGFGLILLALFAKQMLR
ncbi:MAG: MFS transporter, partial [Candidatus Omnitrophica bacterium]|nr:MFS transporter [Candidatus Omnitrophota bacterium]